MRHLETRSTPDVDETLRATLGSTRSPQISRDFDRHLATALEADRGSTRNRRRRRRRLQRFTLAAYALAALLASTAVLVELPMPRDPRVLALTIATLLFVVGTSLAFGIVLLLVRRGVIEPHG